MASNGKVLSFVIKAIDEVTAPFRRLGNAVAKGCKAIFGNLANIKAGFDMIASSHLGASIRAAFDFEKTITDFKVLTGSVDSARDHVEQLREFASSTPLTLDDLTAASKQLLSFGASIDDVIPNLKMLGDISMGDTQKFQGLSLVFSQVMAAGKLMGQDLMQMINQGFNPLTIMAQKSGKSIAQLKEEMSQGRITFDMVREAMVAATSAGGLFANSMQESSKTGHGLVSTLKDKVSDVLRTVGDSFMDLAKTKIGRLIERIDELRRSGKIKEWADKALEAIRPLVNGIENLFDGRTRMLTIVAAKESFIAVFSAGGEIVFAALKHGWDYVTEHFGDIGEAIWKGLKRAAGNILGAGSWLGEQGAKLLGVDQDVIDEGRRKINGFINDNYGTRLDEGPGAAARDTLGDEVRGIVDRLKEKLSEQAEIVNRANEEAFGKASGKGDGGSGKGDGGGDGLVALELKRKENAEAIEYQTDIIRELNAELEALENEAGGLAAAFENAEQNVAAAGQASQAWEGYADAVRQGRQRNAAGDVKGGRDFLDDAKRRRDAEKQANRDKTREEWNKRQLDRIIANNSLNLNKLGESRLDKGGEITTDRLREGWEKRFAGTAQDLERFRQMLEANDAAKAAQEALDQAQFQRWNIEAEQLRNAEKIQQKQEEIKAAQTELDALNKQTQILDRIEQNTREGNFG